MIRPTQNGEELISALAHALTVSVERYEAADRSYRSLCSWLERPASRFAFTPISAYTQGSFRLGTAIRPVNGEEHYDLDVVCEFAISKHTKTQKSLFDDLGYELRKYAARYGMEAPSPWRRCWTLNYADEAQFHMDVLPSVPDGQLQRRLREARSLSLAFVDKSVSITDSEHENYVSPSNNWPVSNPNGYAEWFYERMKLVFESRRRALMLIEAKTDVAQIPAFRVKTPLQLAIQILKRHRDMRFSEQSDGRPSSIVITTLAAHAYNQEVTVTGALFSILSHMDSFIERRDEEYWIVNPSDPRENFADLWKDEPKRKDAFYDWLEVARTDFQRAAEQDDPDGFIDALAPRMGRQLVESVAAHKPRPNQARVSVLKRASRAVQRILDAPHRRPVVWPTMQIGNVQMVSAKSQQDGFRPVDITNDGTSVSRGSTLRFVAQTNVQSPYSVYWQVVNTGPAAVAAGDLRGGFEEDVTIRGTLTKEETASYPGSHSIECFIVKNSYCVARTGPFIVNIR